MGKAYLGTQHMQNAQMPPSSSFTELLLLRMMSCCVEYLLGQLVIFASCDSSTFLSPPASWLARQCERQRSPWPCVSTVQHQLDIPGLSTLSSTNPKHSPMPAAVKKMNSTERKRKNTTLTCIGKNFFTTRVVKIWNKLPRDIMKFSG